MAMQKVFYGPEGIMLSHILRVYDKESLLNYARNLQIRRTSGLKKIELAEKIANELLAPSVMRRRLATFSLEERMLLERAIECPFIPTEDEMEDALSLNEKDYAFLNKQDQLNVPVDVAEAYKKLNTPDFRQYAKKMSWFAQCPRSPHIKNLGSSSRRKSVCLIEMQTKILQKYGKRFSMMWIFKTFFNT